MNKRFYLVGAILLVAALTMAAFLSDEDQKAPVHHKSDPGLHINP